MLHTVEFLMLLWLKFSSRGISGCGFASVPSCRDNIQFVRKPPDFVLLQSTPSRFQPPRHAFRRSFSLRFSFPPCRTFMPSLRFSLSPPRINGSYTILYHTMKLISFSFQLLRRMQKKKYINDIHFIFIYFDTFILSWYFPQPLSVFQSCFTSFRVYRSHPFCLSCTLPAICVHEYNQPISPTLSSPYADTLLKLL